MFRAEVEPHEHEEAVSRATRLLLVVMLAAPTLTAHTVDQTLFLEVGPTTIRKPHQKA